MNDALLKSVMKQHGDKAEDLAKALGIHLMTVYLKIGGVKAEFTQGEIKMIANRYKLSAADIINIFFSEWSEQ